MDTLGFYSVSKTTCYEFWTQRVAKLVDFSELLVEF